VSNVVVGTPNRATRDDVLFDQAIFVTHPGVMAGGADASNLESEQTSFGPNVNWGAGSGTYYLLADDFTLTADSHITGFEVYGYQTGSSTTSTITGLYAQIYDGNPMTGGTAIWGDNATNLMTATAWTNCYRTSGLSGTTRPIMSVTADGLSIDLAAGTYYLVWGLTGTLSSGPWGQPVAILGQNVTGDALQKTSSGWQNMTLGTPQAGAAFLITGTTSGGGGGGGAGTIGLQEPRESEIVWSNCLDKDMYITDADVTVLLNSADSPEGAVVTLTNYNEAEQAAYPMAPVVLDESGFYAWDSFRRGAYKVNVTMEGYEPIEDSINLIDYPNNLINEIHLRYVMTEIIYGVGDVYVSRTGWAMWDGDTGSGENRHLEYYKVMCTSIDGVPIFNHNTKYPFCQLSTDEPFNAPLVEGEHYLCKVACVYSTGMSEWSTPVEWEYEPCDHWGPVDDVVVNQNAQGNHIEWEFEHGFNPYDPGTGPEPPVPGDNATVILTAGDVWGDGSGYQMLLDADANAYGTTIPETGALSTACSGNEAIYAQFEYKIPTNADGVCTTSNMVMNNSVSIEIPAGVYDWCITNPTPGDRIWIAASNGNVGGRQNDYTFEAGKTYEFTVSMYGSNDGVDVVITGGAKNVKAPLACGEVKDKANVIPGDYGYIVRPAYSTSNMVGQRFTMTSESSLLFNIGDIANFDERVYFLYKLMNDSRFSVINAEQTGMFVVNGSANLNAEFVGFIAQNISEFTNLDKYQAADLARQYKSMMPGSMTNALMLDLYVQSRENNMCEFADPFCTDNGMYEFPAGVNAGSGETGPDYDCLYTQPNPAWYYMRIGAPGEMDIHMYSTPEVDIDFCCWGPFDDPTTPCPYGLTEDKVVSCSYSTSWTEHCMIPASAQTGEYYILVITNYSNQACNINFSMVAGAGSTDCGILPPVDIIGFLITMDGEYVAFADPTDRDFTHEGEFGDHEYCVRPIYPGEMVLPDHNYGWSMGCPVCAETNGQIVCEPGAPIHAEMLNDDRSVKVWWGVPPAAPINEWLYYDDGTYATSVGAGGTLYWGTMFPAASMAPYAGTSLTKVAVHTSYACSATLNVYVGGAQPSGSPAATQTFTMAGDQEFMEVTLNTPVPVDGTQNLWITFYQSGENYPADACNDTGDANNRWVSVDGASWMDLSTAGLPGYGWMIRGFVTNQAKGGELVSLPEFKGNVGGELSHTAVVSKPADMSFMSRAAQIVKYNVYRSTEATGTYALIGEVAETGADYYEYIDTPVEAGTYYYQVRAMYSNDCESDPAMAADGSGNNYVSGTTIGDGVGENDGNVALYPNPTKGNVTIEAAGMSRITVVSVLGQVVFDTELDADQYTLNMAQFNAGMYMVRVYTENGVTVKRVTVMQ
jgi:hypothetical protein